MRLGQRVVAVLVLCTCRRCSSEPENPLTLPVEVDGVRYDLPLEGESVMSTVEAFSRGPGGRLLSDRDLIQIRLAMHRKIASELLPSPGPTELRMWTGNSVSSMLELGVPGRLHDILRRSAKLWQHPFPLPNYRGHKESIIPKTIHHIWWQGREDMLLRAQKGQRSRARSSTDWRAQFIPRWVESWKKYHAEPTWTHRFWNESEILVLAQTEFGGIFHSLLLSFPERIKKIDTARYLILLKYGGTVVDVDFECFRCIAPLLNGTHGVLLSEESARQSINCAFMSSRPNHPLWWAVLHEIMWRHSTATNRGVLYQTGPEMLSETVRWWRDMRGSDNNDLRVLSHDRGEVQILYPFSDDDLVHRETMSNQCTVANDCASRYPESFAMHHFAASWYDEYAEFLKLKTHGSK